MSRSIKKFAAFKDYGRNYTRKAKRWASKKVRRYTGEITNGKIYRKVFPSWNISDMKGVHWNEHDDEYKDYIRK